MNNESKIEEWIPDVEEYNPKITKEKWLQLIEDKSVFNENAIVTFACIKNANVATCSDMSEEFGRNKNFYNNNVWLTGKKVHLKTNCKLSERDNEEDRYWSVCCLGRYWENGRFEYKIRPELEEAFEESGVLKKVNLYNNMVDKEQEFRKWMADPNYNDGKEYTSNTINSYCNALKNAPKNLNIEDKYKGSIFTYDDSLLYADVMNKIRKASNFKDVNDRFASGAFNAAMNLYEKFLKNYSQDYYIDQNVMNNDNDKYKKYIDILEANKNLILTGAPGTGKTWLAKRIAKEMGCSDNEIGFVQFHPSYDYTDFVEGLRPVEKDENIGFERKDGVFKEFCKRAIKTENSNQIDNFDECWNKLVEKLNDDDFLDIRLLSGKKSFRIELNEYGTGLANRYYENDTYEKGEWIQGKSKFFSKEQLYNVYKGLPGVPAKGHDNYRKAIVNYMKENLSLKDYFAGSDDIVISKPFIFIIDEINRGEISKIFGELFYCIDPGYRGTDGCVFTQYQNLIPEGDAFKDGFYVPDNVYIIGTMNDIDRSVESMDFAFRRRFAFIEVKANENLDMLNDLDETLAKESKNRLINLNNKISEIEGLDSSYHIGASYFLKLKDYQGDFEKLWNYHLKGLLEEYLRGMSDVKNKLESLKVAYDNESASNN